MVIMLNQSSSERRGYTNAVDWWSLGITTFKLLTGYKPFEQNKNAPVQDDDLLFPPPKKEFPEYSMLFEDIVFPRYVPPLACDFVRSLLNVSETNRLGYGVDGLENVKSHVFFEGIDWEKLVTKHQEPPFLPDLQVTNEIPLYESFSQMMEDVGKSSWLRKMCSPSQQRYYETWDFVSAHTLRVEFGLANEMDQLDRCYKVRQLMGEPLGSTKNPSSGGGGSRVQSRVSR
ncbi:Rps6ka4 [Symbiodinium microadriaticum]|nr:Rps6ka4 [Symbiodinium microadriaticum]